MKVIPEGYVPYRRTPQFTRETVPKGLLHEHRTKVGVWGKIIVVKGTLRYRILQSPVEEHVLQPGICGIVEPDVPHEVALVDDAEFFVEFYALRKDLA